ncbi:ABC transporter ATP-binding protein [Cribrihabitans sp. XS_ASV171]
MTLLTVQNLVTEFHGRQGIARAVDDVSFDIAPGEILGIVGESGSGKSATCRSILKLFGRANAHIVNGTIALDGVGDLVGLSEARMGEVRGSRISFIFQDPLTALNPTMRVGQQISEVILRHTMVTRSEARQQALQLLRDVKVTSPERRLDAYPHELSGGLRQRIVIAMALALQPPLIIADEPTTALDVTVQDQILRLLLDRRDATGTAIILVTHDLGVVAEVCDRVAVMYGGQIIETGGTQEVLHQPAHPYTQALLAALPSAAMRGRSLIPIDGMPPDLTAPPPGCRFAPRCRFSHPECRLGRPALAPRADSVANHLDACILDRSA